MDTLGLDSVLIRLRGAGVRADGRWLLRDIDCDVRAGQVMTVVGPNGAGKTTLLEVLAGARDLTHGERLVASGARIGYAPQRVTRAALPMQALDFMALPAGGDDALARAALAEVGAADLAEASLAALSGGEAARVWMARAMMGAPEVLALDEPTASMDPTARARVYALIARSARERGQAVVFASHDLHMVMDGTDEALCLHEGRVHCSGAPERAMATPQWRKLFGSGAEGLAPYRHRTEE